LERQDLSRMYLAHHELESESIVIIVIVIVMIITANLELCLSAIVCFSVQMCSQRFAARLFEYPEDP